MSRFIPEGRDDHWVDEETGGIVVTRPGGDPASVVEEAEAEAARPAPPSPPSMDARILALEQRVAVLEGR